MAEHDRDDEIGKRYRELPREEPPRALDEAILAAARRELETRPAPLVAPTGRRRWMFPVAAAAVIVLSAVITLHIQREQPDMELATAPPPAARPAEPKDVKPSAPSPPQLEKELPASPEQRREEAQLAQRGEGDRREARAPSVARDAATQAPAAPPPTETSQTLEDRERRKQDGDTRRFAPDPAPLALPPRATTAEAPPAAAAPRALRERDAQQAEREALSRRAEATVAKRADSAETPERMLERIATLRREGLHKEADDLYAEFRRRFPDYKIPEAMRERILPR